MEGALEERKQRVLRRLENTIESVNSIIYEINREIEGIIEDNAELEQTAMVYDTWLSKG